MESMAFQKLGSAAAIVRAEVRFQFLGRISLVLRLYILPKLVRDVEVAA